MSNRHRINVNSWPNPDQTETYVAETQFPDVNTRMVVQITMTIRATLCTRLRDVIVWIPIFKT